MLSFNEYLADVLLLVMPAETTSIPKVFFNMECHVFSFIPGYCLWPSDRYYHQWLRYFRHTLAFRGLGCPLPLDLPPYLDDSEAERT